MEQGVCDIGSIITHEFPLSQITQALETASDAEHALNALIDHNAT